MKYIVSVVVSFALSLTPAFAMAQQKEGKVTSLEKSEQAPFAGTLLSPVAYAKIVVEERYKQSKKILKLEEELEREKVKNDLKMEAKNQEIKALKEGYKAIHKRDKQEIKFLRDYSLKKGSGGDFWTGVGVGSGVTAVIISGVVIFVSTSGS